MILTDNEVNHIREVLLSIATMDSKRSKRHFYANQANKINLIIKRALRREKNTLL